jgi:hypothetical protein
MTHRFEHSFDSPDEGCNVLCIVEYEAEPTEFDHDNYVIDGELHILGVRALLITGFDLDGNVAYELIPDELSEGWAEALNLIADASVREALDGPSCLGECLWETAGFCI